MNRFIFTIIFLGSLSLGYSLRTAKVSATYTYYAPETMSIEEAKRIALERAKIEAISNEFGIIVTQNNSIVISNKNGESEENFYSYGDSEVKGEWIETIDEPKYIISYEDNTLNVTCSVKGKAREITSAKVEFDAKTLRNGTELRFKDTCFKDGDELYLYFRAPIDGYLAAYLLDETAQIVYCILPYKEQTLSSYPIIANKEYVMFSQKNAEKSERAIIDEYTLSCENDKEFNTLYILFSPFEIGKRNGFDSYNEDKPNNISYGIFKQWLSKTLSRDHKIQIQKINITITKQV